MQATLVYWEDEGWMVGKIKEIPGVFSQRETLDELKENIRDAYQLMMEAQGYSASTPGIKDTLCVLIRKQLGLIRPFP